ncbi:acetyl-CoA carboxylase biotin carboxyl carrier protein [Fodinicurvata sediminis]|uniref:acetyl-CoA carboxylase biotin carboxyl carrier protein n=1 Tax=Fodinicurvata sediminis TaxID=1121832 RepID=UPI0003B79318|nr:acetyl-CoA carboxylase biotin carboxyl carrier protein [Fodinicurvata sediminis]
MTGKFPFDEDAVRKLAGILEDTGLSEIEVESGEARIRVARNQTVVASAPAAPAASAGAPLAAPAASEAESAQESGHVVASPMVGTVYLAPEPGAAPYVKVGDKVSEGQTLLIVEAMKVMNTLPAPVAGVVRQILVDDGQPVEFDEPMIVIE